MNQAVFLRKPIILSLGVILLAQISFAQTYWKKTYDGPGTMVPNAMVKTKDGNFIIAGSVALTGTNDTNVLLIKVSVAGDMLWTKTYGGHSVSYANAITGMQDGNFIVAGAITSVSTKKQDVYLLKINLQGDTLWTKTMGDTENDEGKGVVQQPSGELLIACNWFVARDSSLGIIEMSSAGEVLWNKHYRGNWPCGFALTSDSCYIVASGQANLQMIKINFEGGLVWKKDYTQNGDFFGANTIMAMSANNYFVGGWSYSFASLGFYDLSLKVNSNGDTLWHNSYCTSIFIGPHMRYDARISTSIPSADGNCLVAGWLNGSALFQKITNAGEFIWDQNVSNNTSGVVNCIAVSDKGIILAGGLQVFPNPPNVNITKFEIFSLVDDQYAYKGVPFSFKIPVSGDSLAYTYRAGKMPAGMTISNGGTIQWMPTTDTSTLEHIELFVANSNGGGDSLSFNLYVNSKDNPIAAIRAPNSKTNAISQNHELVVKQINSMVQFSTGLESGAFGIYDVRGRCLARVPIVNGIARWTGFDVAGNKSSTGTYFVQYIGSNKASNTKAASFLLMPH